MKSEMPGYLKEIEDADWVQEIVMERFDNALELMTPTSIIYGGAIRDCVAGKELLGDLDLAITDVEFDSISGKFNTNPKWIPYIKKQSGMSIKSSGDLATKFAPFSGISSFITMGGKIVQLITSKYQDRDPLQSVLSVARKVDIVCCGMAMLCDGRVFETVPGAYQDCVDGVLRINKNSDTIYTDALKARVEKLVNRGWKNTIDVDRVIRDHEDTKEKARRKELRLAELRSKRNKLSPIEGLEEYNLVFGYPDDNPIVSGYTHEITKKHVDLYFSGQQKECLKVLEGFALIEHINMRVRLTPIGSVYFETINGEQANKIKSRLHTHYKKHGKERTIQVRLVDNTKPFTNIKPIFKINWGTSAIHTSTSSTSTSSW